MDAATLKQILDAQTAALTAAIAQMQGTSSKASQNEQLASSLANRITNFVYIPEEGITFQQWYDRFGKYFTVEGGALTEETKVRLLLSKISTGEYSLYSKHIAP